MAPSFCLDYGADEHRCAESEFEICERGMRFYSHWQFSLGTQLAVAFSRRDADGKIQRLSARGIIVDCEQTASRCHRTTLLFLELPDPLRTVIRQTGQPHQFHEAGFENRNDTESARRKTIPG